MHDLIEIYIKLQIATITMLVPMLIFYINHASEAKRTKDEAYDKKIRDLQKESQLDSGDPEKFKSQVSDLHTEIAKITNQRENDLRLLNPLRQMKRIYSTLILSFLLIILDVMVRNNVFNTYNHILSVILISLSLFMFSITVIFITRVAIVGVKSKEDIEKKN